MDLNSLFFQHQVALLDHAHGRSAEARRWAGERADYFATRIVAVRGRLGVTGKTFDFRQSSPTW